MFNWSRTATRYLLQPLALWRGYQAADFRPDLVAGITVGVVLLPQAIAYTLIAGLPPVTGLYVAVIATAVGALWGSSIHLTGGPTNTAALLTIAALTPLIAPGDPGFLLAASLLAVMAGSLQFVVGITRLGVLANFVSHSVVVGFSAGAGVLIIVQQLAPLLGMTVPKASFLHHLWLTAQQLPGLHPASAAIGLGTFALLLLQRRYRPNWPGPLIVLLLAVAAVAFFGLDQQGVRTIGALPASLPPPTDLRGFLNLDLIQALSTGAFAIAAVGMVEAAAITRSLATISGQRLDLNQEFVGRGLANIAAGLFSGYPSSGSFNRSLVALEAGARTRLATVITALFSLVALLVLGPLGRWLPNAALAGLLVVIAWAMINWSEIGRILRGARYDAIIMVSTFLAMLLLNLQFAVLIGILLSLAFYIVQTSAPRVQSVVPDNRYLHFVPQKGRDACPQLGVITISGDLYFGAVNAIEDAILDHLDHYPDQRFLLLRMHQVNQIDFSGIHMLETVLRVCRERRGQLFIARAQPQVARLMESTRFTQQLGAANVLDSDGAISYLFHHRLDPAICIYECPVRVFQECQNLPKSPHVFHPPPMGIDWPLPPGITPHALWKQLHGGSAAAPPPRLVDVREWPEFRRSHIPEAESLPLAHILNGELPEGDRPIVIICRNSRRSQRAASAMQAAGISDLHILEGGMVAWEAANLLTAVASPWELEKPLQSSQ
jgi:SulP family sulfate permease